MKPHRQVCDATLCTPFHHLLYLGEAARVAMLAGASALAERVDATLEALAGDLVRTSDLRPDREPFGERFERRRAHRHAASLRAFAEHMRAGIGGVDPAGRVATRVHVEPDQLSDAQAAAVEQLDDARVARRQARVAGLVAMGDERDRMVDGEGLGQRLGRPRSAHAVDRVGGDPPVAAEPAVEAAPRGEHERDRAGAQPLAVHLRRPASHVQRLDDVQRQGEHVGAVLQAIEGLAVQRERALGEAPLDL